MWKRWERGKHEPDELYKKIIANTFGTTVESLFGEASSSSSVIDYQQIITTGNVAVPADERIIVPCQTSTGKIIFVAVARRAFLRSLGLGAVTELVPPLMQSPADSTSFLPSDVNPVHHFSQLRRMLIENDNLFGPLQVIPTVELQIEAMRRLRQYHRGSDADDLLYLKAQYAEFCGWLYHDVGDLRSAQYWTDRALEWAHVTGNREIVCYIFARKSQLAGDMRDVLNSVDLAEVGKNYARPNSRLAAITSTFAGYGYALCGRASESNRMFDKAREILTCLDEGVEPAWGPWLNESYVEVHRARGLLLLGKHSIAADGFRTAIEQLPLSYHRDRGVYLARESIAYAAAGEPEQAVNVGMEALRIAELTGSARIINELIHLSSRLAPWIRVPCVADFEEAFRLVVPNEGLIYRPTTGYFK